MGTSPIFRWNYTFLPLGEGSKSRASTSPSEGPFGPAFLTCCGLEVLFLQSWCCGVMMPALPLSQPSSVHGLGEGLRCEAARRAVHP